MLKLDEGDRQIVLLALAELALSRPGWDHALENIAEQIDNPTPEGPEMYRELKRINADRVRVERGPMLPLTAKQDDEDIQRWIFGVEYGALADGQMKMPPVQAGDFLKTFVAAALRADHQNYPLLRPVIIALKQRFPKYRYEGEL